MVGFKRNPQPVSLHLSGGTEKLLTFTYYIRDRRFLYP
jgi:hypothetical protein